jgi:hypothetical protein
MLFAKENEVEPAKLYVSLSQGEIVRLAKTAKKVGMDRYEFRRSREAYEKEGTLPFVQIVANGALEQLFPLDKDIVDYVTQMQDHGITVMDIRIHLYWCGIKSPCASVIASLFGNGNLKYKALNHSSNNVNNRV